MIPKISVIIPLYNKVNYIADTINSIIYQTHGNWEMLIIDNGSTDGSLDKVKQIKDNRLQLLQSPKRGPGAARNYGIIHARGEWIQFLDADDLLLPNHFQQQLETARQNPDTDIVVCCWEEFADNNPQQRVLKKPAGIDQSPEFLRNTAIAFTPWAVHAALVKRVILKGEFLWSEELDRYLAEDTSFWFRLISNYQVGYSDSVGVLYRKGLAQSRTNHNPEKWFEGLHQVVQNNLNYVRDKYIINPKQCESLVRLYSGIYILATEQNSLLIQNKSYQEANFWLKSYFKHNNRPKLSMVIRRLLGIKLFLQLNHD